MAVDRSFERRLAGLVNGRAAGALQGGLKGVEKESLRVTPEGRIATDPAPDGAGLGAHQRAHHHRLLRGADRAGHAGLPRDLGAHPVPLRPAPVRLPHLGDELLWATSMPCAIEGDASIPIAEYGPSNVGRMKTVYRRGLGLRYGRVMQAISGVHFNYSLPGALLAGAGRPVREPRRRAGLPLRRVLRAAAQLPPPRLDRPVPVRQLAGDLPVVPAAAARWTGCRSSRPGSLYAPHATSLRMSDLGYRNKSQAGLDVSVNSLDHYVRDLTRGDHARRTPTTRSSASRSTASTGSSTPTCCRSRTSTTASSARSASRCPASGRPRRCGAAASSTSRCARSTSAPSTRSASTRTSCASSRRSRRSACCAPARRSSRRSRPSSTATTGASRARAAGPASRCAATGATCRCATGRSRSSTRCAASASCSTTATRSGPTRPRSTCRRPRCTTCR